MRSKLVPLKCFIMQMSESNEPPWLNPKIPSNGPWAVCVNYANFNLKVKFFTYLCLESLINSLD